jgi:hypothetical protein
MSLNEVTELGKYYVDYQNGVIFTYSTMGGIVSYFYNQFPYRLFWQPIKIYPYTDVDKKYFHRNTVIDDDGNLAYQSLNSKGVEVANLVYSAHPLTWGK